MDFTLQELRMVEFLRRRQRLFRDTLWKSVRWILVLQGVIMIGFGKDCGKATESTGLNTRRAQS